MRGIRFLMKDHTWYYYDPVREEDFKELEDRYILTLAYTYEIFKVDVLDYEWYNLDDYESI